MRYFLEMSYKGTSYNGWQKQDNAPSVQEILEKALSTLTRESVQVTGAGRTDTGVHASYYVVHFDTEAPIDDGTDFIYHLNSILPNDIAAYTVSPVGERAHARFDAEEREYRYYILLRKDPFRTETTWQYPGHLDERTINEVAAALLKARDFTTFSKLHSGNKTNICSVTKAEWVRSGDELVFTIRADRFLRNMVRAIVGTLVDVGRGKITPEDFREALESMDRSKASGSAPARGLFLADIKYPAKTFKRKTDN